MHAEGRKDIYLIGLEQVQLIINTHIFAAVKMDIQLIIVMTVVLGYFHTLVKTIMGFISLAAPGHRLEWRPYFIVFH